MFTNPALAQNSQGTRYTSVKRGLTKTASFADNADTSNEVEFEEEYCTFKIVASSANNNVAGLPATTLRILHSGSPVYSHNGDPVELVLPAVTGFTWTVILLVGFHNLSLELDAVVTEPMDVQITPYERVEI